MTPKHIVLISYGSRGDVEPFIALGAGLTRAGYAVRLAAPQVFAELAQAHGVELHALPGDPEQLALSLTDRAGTSFPRQVARMIEHVFPLAEVVLTALEAATADASAVVHSFLMVDAGHTLARRRGIPDISAQFFPVFAATSAFPGVGHPDLALGPLYHRATHGMNNVVFRFGARLLYSRLRAAHPHLPPLEAWPFSGPVAARSPLLFAFSPLVLPRPSDWPANVHLTGYWPLPAPAGWAPPSPLARFLEAFPAPVYIGFGSMRSRRMPAFVQAAVEALTSAGLRGVIDASPASLAGIPLPDSIRAVQGVPHAWLFPHMRLILHHGGAGTTGAALRAGVPSAVLPFWADQFLWAKRTQALGVGPAPLPASRITARRLRAMLDDAESDPAIRTRASELGNRLRREDGVAAAIEIIRPLLC
ncbi:MAG: glycosyltransferase [Chloroflexi bacterium]|nr:glycosyltransferase [Chloroflexota bacterium]